MHTHIRSPIIRWLVEMITPNRYCLPQYREKPARARIMRVKVEPAPTLKYHVAKHRRQALELVCGKGFKYSTVGIET